MLSNSHDEYQFKYHQIRILPILYSIFCFFALLPISIVPSLLIPLCPRIHSYLTWNSPERQFFERREPRVVMVAGSSSRQARRHKESAHLSISRTSSSTPRNLTEIPSCQSSYHILCSERNICGAVPVPFGSFGQQSYPPLRHVKHGFVYP